MTNIVVKVLESYEFWIFVILIAGFVIWPVNLLIKELWPKSTSVSSNNSYNSKTTSNSTYSLTSSEDNSGGRVRGKRNISQHKRKK
jgi:hypothetical protein